MRVCVLLLMCAAGLACADRSPFQPYGVVASSVENITALTADGDDLYWYQPGKLVRGRKDGSRAPVVLFEQATARGASVTVDATHVYWILHDNPTNTDSIMRVPKQGGAPEPLAPGERDACGLVVRGDNVYWLSRPTLGSNEPIQVRRVPVSGGTATSIVTSSLRTACSMAADDAHLYLATEHAESLFRVPIPDGAAGALELVVTAGHLRTDQPNELHAYLPPLPIHADATRVLWAVSSSPKGVLMWAKGTSEVTRVALTDHVTALTVDGDEIYFVDAVLGNDLPLTGRVRVVDLTEGDASSGVALSAEGKPFGLALDEDRVFWGDGKYSGSIFSLERR